ncbi:MAG: hypothetical protein NC218_06600 [Acetobacter sp.]|nr:hypothetical protein [Acetobacter sp.]
MYLLMLLATYMSAIYGYNLSIRPDYDRDVPHKRAAAVVYKFTHHHNAVKKVVNMIKSGDLSGKYLIWLLPEDFIYTKDSNAKNEENIVLTYKQGSHEVEIPLREKGRLGSDISGGENIMPPGRVLYGSDMMVSKILCPDNEIDETTVNPVCTPETDPSNPAVIKGSCCGKGGTSYLVSYRKLDARWLNRLTNQVNSDMFWAFGKEAYSNNIGVITWNGSNWEFNGMIRLLAVYRKDKEKFLEDHKDDPAAFYSSSDANRTYWKMPNKVFKRDFFTDAEGKNKDFCKHGCLFKIETI